MCVFVPVTVEMNPSEGLHKGVFSRRQNKYKEASYLRPGRSRSEWSSLDFQGRLQHFTPSGSVSGCRGVSVCTHVYVRV